MNKIDDLIEQAKDLFRKNMFSDSLNLFNKILELDNNRADVYFEVGKINFIINDFEQAKKYLEKAIDLDDKQIYAYDFLVKIYNQNNDFGSLEKIYNKLVLFFTKEKYDNNIDLVVIMFNVARYINKYEEVIKIVKENIKYIKKCSLQQKRELMLVLADLYYLNGKKRKSLIYKYKYLENNFEDTEIILSIVKEYIEIKKIKKAYEILKLSLSNEKNKYNYDIWKHIVIIIEKIPEEKLTKEELSFLFKIIPDDFVKFKNVILNELEIIDNKTELLSKPRTMVVTLTSNCNIRCLMCKVHKYNWQLPDKTKNEIIKLMPYLESIVWLGGEVFLYKHFDELFEQACKNDVVQDIITNSMLLNEERIIKLLKNNVNLAISVDGVTKDVFEHIRVGASFDKLIENLELIKFYRNKFNSQNHYRMNSLILKSNYKQIEQFIDFAHKYGFNNLFIDCISTDLNSQENIFYYYRDDEAVKYINSVKQKIADKAKAYNIDFNNNIPSIEYLDYTKDDIKKVKEEIVIGCDKWGENFDIPVHNKEIKEKYCFVPWKKLFVDKDGYIRPDCFCKNDRSIGNVFKDSLFDMWNSDKMKIYRSVNIYSHSIEKVCQIACLKGKIDNVYRK